MIKIRDEYWSQQFYITCEDLNRTAKRLERVGMPQDLKAIALPIIEGRIKHGHDSSPAVMGELTGRWSARIWDPAGAWQVGDAVLVAYDRFGNSKYEAFLGKIRYLDQNVAEIQLDELQSTETFPRALPDTANGQKNDPAVPARGKSPVDFAEKMVQSGAPDEQAQGILLKHGGRILTCLEEALRQDPRFTELEGKWYPIHKLPRINHESLQAVHHFLLQNQPSPLDDLLSVVNEEPTRDVSLFKMAVQVALGQSPDRFENMGTSEKPLWKARLPAYDQAEVTSFAFDPQTFEILCRPGQRLNRRKAHRLQELNLYAHVVTFTEWQQMASR